jgi:hypothetical protein
MKISLDDLREAAAVVGEAGGPEAAIIAQFVVDLAVTARFNAAGQVIAPLEARRLLRLWLTRHRALTYRPADTIH